MKTLDELVADKILDLVHYVLLKFIIIKSKTPLAKPMAFYLSVVIFKRLLGGL